VRLAADSVASQPAFIVRPAPGEKASSVAAVYWTPTYGGEGLMIVWTGGLDGVSMRLVPDSGEGHFKDTARTFTDVSGAERTSADVTARHIVFGLSEVSYGSDIK
jgi:hypothetical protein